MISKSLRKTLMCVLSALLAVCAFACLTFSANFANGEAASEITTFDMIGASVRTADPSGIRFTTKVNKDYKDTELNGKTYSFGTLIIPTEILGSNELTRNTDNVLDVAQTK